MAPGSSSDAGVPGSNAPTGRRLGELRASDFADHVGPESILILPVGAVEQHGPHLPFTTDLVIADACARAVVVAAGDERSGAFVGVIPIFTVVVAIGIID